MQKHSRMISVCRVLAAVAVTVLLIGSATVQAQDVAVGQVTATVLTMLTIDATQALAFGDVMQGVPKIMGKNVDASSGIFTITGALGKQIACYMQLPDYLWNSTNTDRLVIAFADDDAEIDTDPTGNTPSAPGAGVSADPHNLGEFLLNAVDGKAAVYLGGTVWPTVDQRNDAYTADIVVTVAYTGV
jgi:hypothetical protein